MAGTLPGSLLVQTRLPLDDKYLVGNSLLATLNTGLTYQGLLRFSTSDDTLWVNLSTGWKQIPLSSVSPGSGSTTGGTTTTTSTTLTIGTVTSGTTASATITNGKLNLVLPKAADGVTGTVSIERVELSADQEPHILNIGDTVNAKYVIQLPVSTNGGSSISTASSYIIPVTLTLNGAQTIQVATNMSNVLIWVDELILASSTGNKYYRRILANELWSYSGSTLNIKTEANLLAGDRIAINYIYNTSNGKTTDTSSATPTTPTFTKLIPVNSNNTYSVIYKTLTWITDSTATPFLFVDNLSTSSSNPANMLVYAPDNTLIGKLEYNGADTGVVNFEIEYPVNSGTIYKNGYVNGSTSLTTTITLTNGSIKLSL